MSDSKVSVIIPTYNGAKYICEAIDSVLSQSFPRVECIVIDDGSTDDTADKVEKYGSRIVYRYQDNAERSSARNNGLSCAQGDFVSFLDADDFLAADKIEDQLRFLQANPEFDVVYSKVHFFNEGDRSYFSLKRKTPSGDLLEELLYGNFIPIHSPLIRRSAIERTGGFDPGLSHNEDWEFLLRLALSGSRFGFIDKFHAFCRLHPENTSGNVLKMFRSKWEVVRTFVTAHAEELAARNIDCERVLSYHKADYGKALILNGDAEEGRRLVAEACAHVIPNRLQLRLLSLASMLFGSSILRGVEAATHGIRKWNR